MTIDAPLTGTIITVVGAIIVALIGGYFALRTYRPLKPSPTVVPTLPPANRPRILIIDDDASFTEAARATLNGEYEVLAFSSVFVACDALVDAREYTKPFAVVIIDYNMPGLSGEEMIRLTRILQPQAKTVLISGGFLDGRIAKLADDVWSKPLRQLKERVAKLLS